MIPESFIQEVLSRTDVVSVVDKYVPLKKAGANMSAVCPFHNEKSPSFTVSPVKQFYHCFGCGAHGTAITFLMEYNGMGFVDALSELAEQVGLKLPERGGQEPTANFTEIQNVLQRANGYYQAALTSNPLAIDYLKSRGISTEISARFGLGYAPSEWHNLKLLIQDYAAKDVQDSGLVIAGEAGNHYDRFRNRLMFPIHNQRGSIIGFGGRIVGEKTEKDAKYINSPETPLFQKGNELYGLFLARKAIKDAGRALVVEGYTDVVALAQYGVDYSVATLGTATTGEHIRKLMKQTDNIVFCFDGDDAGKKAAWRATENALPIITDQVVLKYLFLPMGHDPDSFIRQFGKSAFEALVEMATPFSDYIIGHFKGDNPLKGIEDNVRFLNGIEPALGKLNNAPKVQLFLRKEISVLTGVKESDLIAVKPASPQPPKVFSARMLMNLSLERKLALILMLKPSLALDTDSTLVQSDSGESDGLSLIVKTCIAHPNFNTSVVIRAIEPEMDRAMLSEIESDLNLIEETLSLDDEVAGVRKLIEAKRKKMSDAKFMESIKGKAPSQLTADEVSMLMNIRM